MIKKKNKLRILTFIFCTFTLLINVSGRARSDSPEKILFTYSIPPKIEKIQIATEQVSLTSDWTYPVVLGDVGNKAQWQHVSRTNTTKTLAGIQGDLIVDVFENSDLRLMREFWCSVNKDEIAIRQKITNLNDKSIQLKSLMPLSLSGMTGLNFKQEKRADHWSVLIQKRLKNGKPISIAPSDTQMIEIDPFCVFHANEKNTPDLLIGYLSQRGHLARLLLQFDKKGQRLDFSSLVADCQFDGCLIPQGGERTSQWVYIKAGFDPNALIAGFADRVGVYHNVHPPAQPAPSVFCTWYFHGREYNEQFFMDDITALQKNRMPFDAFLIDDCWANGNWGYWNTGDAFPGGMKNVTDQMRESGYRPGIWTAPYSVDMESDLAKEHPEWLLRTTEDTLVVFGYAVKAWILDPTYPGVTEHIESVYRRLTNDYGFSYFKFDFMRSVFVFDNAKFYDPHVTRLEAYQMGLESIRKAVGPDAYLSVCGGHFGGSLGIANSQRSGSDVVSIWNPHQIDCFRQNILRTWMSRLWHIDPDAVMIRKRETPYHDPNHRHAKLSLGKLTDTEALTFTLNQYVGGGMVCFTEYLKELQPERREMYRHIIPSINTPSKPLDIYDPLCPSMMLTEVKPVCTDLAPWITVAMINWEDKDKKGKITLTDEVIGALKSELFVVSEFFSQKTLGIFSKDDVIDLGTILPHHSRLLRIGPWDGKTPVLTGTDLHFSGGGVEIEAWHVMNHSVGGKINTGWNYPVNLSVAFPADTKEGYILKTLKIAPGQSSFCVFQ